jgi:hypothetical protein
MLCEYRAKSGATSNSTPSCSTTWYGARFRLLTWVSTDTSAKVPAQLEKKRQSIAARPPLLRMWALAFSLRLICIGYHFRPEESFTEAEAASK